MSWVGSGDIPNNHSIPLTPQLCCLAVKVVTFLVRMKLVSTYLILIPSPRRVKV